MFSKILIANRGEIAVRIIRACKEMALPPSPSTPRPTATACMSPSPTSASASVRPRRRTATSVRSAFSPPRCSPAQQAIHPGLRLPLRKCGVCRSLPEKWHRLIGPDAECMARLSDKTSTKEAFAKTALRPIPGAGVLSCAEEAAKEAESIGYPVMLKARSGGGGRGIRVIPFAGRAASGLSSGRGRE